MREIRLYIDVPLTPNSELTLPVATAQHALRALRLQTDDRVILFNGDGHQYPARLTTSDPRSARVWIETIETPARESSLQITLLQALARGEKMDWIVQKATELGVARIVPVASERSEVKLDAARGGKRLEHWRAIAVAACEQCGRNVLPEIDAPAALDAYLKREVTTPPGSRWMLHPGESTRPRDLGALVTPLTVAIGPEGGFGMHDLAALRAAGYRPLALGPRILRTETAGMATLAALQTLYGDL